jgi:hypothetical protein
VEHCQSTVLEGPGKKMRWGVPDGTRDDATGELVHDDLLVSAATQLAGLLRVQHLLGGDENSEIARTISQAISEVSKEMGITLR